MDQRFDIDVSKYIFNPTKNLRANMIFKMNLFLSSTFLFLTLTASMCQASTGDYFPLPYDGEKWKMHSIDYSNEPGLTNVPDPTTERVNYFLTKGTKVVSNINCWQSYSSPDGVFLDDDDVSYEGVVGNLYVLVGNDRKVPSDNSISTTRYNPYYVFMKLDMEVGDSYSYSYTVDSQSSNSDSSPSEVTIDIIAIESIDTYYGSYPDTLKFRITESYTTEIYGGIIITTTLMTTYWISSNADQVRTVVEGEGWTSTTDYLWEELSSPPDTDTDGDNIIDNEDNCPAVSNPDQSDSDEDNVGNTCDNCPNTPSGDEVDTNGCSSSQLDSDSDGINDQWEIDNFGNLDTVNGTSDYDQDGYLDIIEYRNGTDPIIQTAPGGTDYDQRTDNRVPKLNPVINLLLLN